MYIMCGHDAICKFFAVFCCDSCLPIKNSLLKINTVTMSVFIEHHCFKRAMWKKKNATHDVSGVKVHGM